MKTIAAFLSFFILVITSNDPVLKMDLLLTDDIRI